MSTNKKVPLNLKELNTDVIAVMTAFTKEALKAHWTDSEIGLVLNEAMASDYVNFIGVISSHCE
jgi:hypothetical protein